MEYVVMLMLAVWCSAMSLVVFTVPVCVELVGSLFKDHFALRADNVVASAEALMQNKTLLRNPLLTVQTLRFIFPMRLGILDVLHGNDFVVSSADLSAKGVLNSVAWYCVRGVRVRVDGYLYALGLFHLHVCRRNDHGFRCT